MLSDLYDLRVTVVSYGEVGRDRLDKPVMGEVARAEGVPFRLEQSGSDEGAEYVAGVYKGFCPPTVQLTSSSRVLHGDRTFQVDGEPAPQSIPGFPALDHLVVRLTIVGG